jgi:hypothetical protein
MMRLLGPLGPVLDAVSERLLYSLAQRPAAESPKETASQSAREVPCDIDPVLSSLETRDPIEAAKTAIGQGNFVLIGLYGFTGEVPGHSENLECWADQQGVLPIPGTSDAILCAEHGRLQDVARSFAARYNDFLISELRVRSPGKCAA